MDTSQLSLLEHHNQLTDHVLKSELPRPIKLFMSVLSTYYNLNKQSAQLTRRTLAARLGLSMSHVSALIAQAVKLGVLESTAQFEPVPGSNNGMYRQTANLYQFKLSYFGLYYDKQKIATKKRLRSLGIVGKGNKSKQPKPDNSQHQKQIIDRANQAEAERQNHIKQSVEESSGKGFELFASLKSSLWGKKPYK